MEVHLRWDRLFGDLEALAGAERARQRDTEIADRTRRERALLDLQARMLANVGKDGVSFRLAGEVLVTGRLVDVGPDWALVETGARPVVVALAAVHAITGLGKGARKPSIVARSFSLGAVLRAASRDRSLVELVDVSGSAATGTIESVGSDHLELASPSWEAPRREHRRDAVSARVLVPLWSLSTVRQL